MYHRTKQCICLHLVQESMSLGQTTSSEQYLQGVRRKGGHGKEHENVQGGLGKQTNVLHFRFRYILALQIPITEVS